MSLKFLILFLSWRCCAALYLKDGHSVKIVGGTDAKIEDFPYQADFELSRNGETWSHQCGAAIIGPKSVITAAHCVSPDSAVNVRIRVGNAKRGEGQFHAVSYIEPHEDYSIHPILKYPDNDIAFAVVDPPFSFDQFTQPIGIADLEPVAGKMGNATGWGRTQEGSSLGAEILQKVSLPVVDRDECAKNYTGIAPIYETMICAGYPEGGRSTCKGDSGGPFVVDQKLVGLVSWGKGCARPSHPAVFTNVANFAPWIRERLETYDSLEKL